MKIKKVETKSKKNYANQYDENQMPDEIKFLQVNVEDCEEGEAETCIDNMVMPLQNINNYSYIGEFYLGSGEY